MAFISDSFCKIISVYAALYYLVSFCKSVLKTKPMKAEAGAKVNN